VTPERKNKPLLPPQKKPYNLFGLTHQKAAWWRLSDKRFREILFNKLTTIHPIILVISCLLPPAGYLVKIASA
jgi:hypothetical protein